MIIATQRSTLDDELRGLPDGAVEGCPNCGTEPAGQDEVRRVQDGALLRLDRKCRACGLEHPTWFDRLAA